MQKTHHVLHHNLDPDPPPSIRLACQMQILSPDQLYPGGLALTQFLWQWQVNEGSWTALPPLSLSGDVAIELDDGTVLKAHSMYLQHASTIFDDILRPQAPAGTAGSTATNILGSEARLPLSETTKKQALLLLQCLYAWNRQAWAEALDPPELVQVARVAHKYGILPMLQLADSCLVRKCSTQDAAASNEGEWMNVQRAPAQLQMAQDLALDGFEAHCAQFMGAHAHAVDLSKLDARTAALLKGAARRGKIPVPPSTAAFSLSGGGFGFGGHT